MTTAQETRNVGEALRNHRETNTLSKAAMYRALSVSAGTYDTWEGGVYIPGDEYAERIAEVLDLELQEVVWMLYRSRIERGTPPLHVMSPYVPSWFRRPIDVQAETATLAAA
jgi:hypothetical protein